MSDWSWTFWKAAVERAAKTLAQSLLSLWGVTGMGLLDIDLTAAASTAGMATVLSLLFSVVSNGVGPSGSPSLVGGDPGN